MALLLQCCLCLIYFYFFAKSRWGQWQDLSSITIYTLLVITTWYLPINLLPCRLMCQLQQDGRARFPKQTEAVPPQTQLGTTLNKSLSATNYVFVRSSAPLEHSSSVKRGPNIESPLLSAKPFSLCIFCRRLLNNTLTYTWDWEREKQEEILW